MAKLKMAPAATFDAEVKIPCPGGELVGKFQFEWLSVNEYQELMDKSAAGEISDAECLLELVAGWDFEEEFNRESVDMLLGYYPAAPMAIMQAYGREFFGAREKN